MLGRQPKSENWKWERQDGEDGGEQLDLIMYIACMYGNVPLMSINIYS